jgi:hemolysin III
MQRFREPWSGFTHLLGTLLSIIGLVCQVALTRSDPPKMVSMVVYGLTLLFVFASSTTLHLYNGSQRAIRLLNRIDHAAIYTLIAGSYTPVCFNMLSGIYRWPMIILVWGLALGGIVYKLFFFQFEGRLSTLAYVGMGWLALIAFPQVIARLPLPAIALLVAGGVIYTLGALFYSLEDRTVFKGWGWHEVWHLMVLAGSGLHFAMIAGYIA